MRRLVFGAFAFAVAVFPALAIETEFSASYRARAEYRNNRDMKADVPDDVFFVNSRLRISATVWNESVKIKGTVQDSRIFGVVGSRVSSEGALETVGYTATNARGLESLDVAEAFLELRSEPFALTVGRQRVFYGEHRLLGTFDWSNVANSFDGVKVRVGGENLTFDAFGFLLRENTVREGAVEVRTGVEGKSTLWGGYLQAKPFDFARAHLYLLYLRDDVRLNWAGVGFEEYQRDTSSPANIFALGTRFEGDVEAGAVLPFWAVEGVFEFGNAWSDNLNAFALSVRAGGELDITAKPKAFVEWDIASGTTESDRQNGVRRTFYNFFPTNHIHYGYADLFSWKNINAVRLSLSAKPLEPFALQVDVWKFWLFTEDDWWYHAGQRPLLAEKPPYPSRDAGLELDLTLKVSVLGVRIMAGYSAFFPGELPRKLGRSARQDWTYLQISAKL